jgi:uncharacterized protein
MKKIIVFLSCFVCILIISALLAPVIYQYTDFKFHRIMTRLIMVQFLALAFWYYKKADKTNLKNLFLSYGLKWHGKSSRSSLIQGFVVTFSVLAILIMLEMFLGAREFRLNIKTKWPLQIIEYTCAAFIIGFLEEFFFRGMVFEKAKKFSLFWAFVLTNSFYSIIHFLKAKHVPIGDTASVKDSFRLIVGFFGPLSDPLAILPGFIGLLIFGLLLSYAYWRTGSLYHSIGIHAGAVFFLKIDGFFMHINPDASVLLYGDKNVYTGILGWIFIVGIGFIMHFIFKRQTSPPGTIQR